VIFLKYILSPFALMYGLFMFLRRFSYSKKLFKRHTFNVPIILVGNIAVGGTGKTPHVEYLIDLLSESYRISCLSRGYKRKSKGFIRANVDESAHIIGDEPAQYKQKYKDLIDVAVCENRVKGIREILKFEPKTDIIIMDDGFQHLSVKPGLSIILSDFYNLYTHDYPMPFGRLREFKSAAQDADIIVITKCPIMVSPLEIKNIRSELKLQNHQSLLFSHFKYGEWIPLTQSAKEVATCMKSTQILLVTGIANSYPILAYAREKCIELKELKFGDHQEFTPKDIQAIKNEYDAMLSKSKIILTTEKDAMRFSCMVDQNTLNLLPIFYVPIKVAFQEPFGKEFNQIILDYVRKNTTNG
jgi:tetraacyldisaccharide 4'-kinase